jgi:hypothetical protein
MSDIPKSGDMNLNPVIMMAEVVEVMKNIAVFGRVNEVKSTPERR